MAMSFLGTQPLSTQVPPVPPLSSLEMKSRGSSHSAAFAPAWALRALWAAQRNGALLQDRSVPHGQR